MHSNCPLDHYIRPNHSKPQRYTWALIHLHAFFQSVFVEFFDKKQKQQDVNLVDEINY